MVLYDKIVNPKTNRKVNINSKLGRNILKQYLNYSQGGAKNKAICQNLKNKTCEDYNYEFKDVWGTSNFCQLTGDEDEMPKSGTAITVNHNTRLLNNCNTNDFQNHKLDCSWVPDKGCINANTFFGRYEDTEPEEQYEKAEQAEKENLKELEQYIKNPVLLKSKNKILETGW